MCFYNLTRERLEDIISNEKSKNESCKKLNFFGNETQTQSQWEIKFKPPDSDTVFWYAHTLDKERRVRIQQEDRKVNVESGIDSSHNPYPHQLNETLDL